MTTRLTLGLAGLAAVLLLVSAVASTFPAASQPTQAEAQQPTRVEAVAGDEGIQP